jgi:hypothetical protein
MRCGRTFRLARTHPAHARLKPQGVALVTHTGCFNAAVSTGSCRKRLPVAAKIALVTAGTIAEVPASPIPDPFLTGKRGFVIRRMAADSRKIDLGDDAGAKLKIGL